MDVAVLMIPPVVDQVSHKLMNVPVLMVLLVVDQVSHKLMSVAVLMVPPVVDEAALMTPLAVDWERDWL